MNNKSLKSAPVSSASLSATEELPKIPKLKQRPTPIIITPKPVIIIPIENVEIIDYNDFGDNSPTEIICNNTTLCPVCKKQTKTFYEDKKALLACAQCHHKNYKKIKELKTKIYQKKMKPNEELRTRIEYIGFSETLYSSPALKLRSKLYKKIGKSHLMRESIIKRTNHIKRVIWLYKDNKLSLSIDEKENYDKFIRTVNSNSAVKLYY